MAAPLDKPVQYIVSALAFAIGAFHLLNVSGLFVLSTREVRVLHLLVMLTLLFLTTATAKRWQDSVIDRIAGFVLAGLAVASSHVRSFLIMADVFPEALWRYSATHLPHLVVNGRVHADGELDEEMILRQIALGLR